MDLSSSYACTGSTRARRPSSSVESRSTPTSRSQTQGSNHHECLDETASAARPKFACMTWFLHTQSECILERQHYSEARRRQSRPYDEGMADLDQESLARLRGCDPGP